MNRRNAIALVGALGSLGPLAKVLAAHPLKKDHLGYHVRTHNDHRYLRAGDIYCFANCVNKPQYVAMSDPFNDGMWISIYCESLSVVKHRCVDEWLERLKHTHFKPRMITRAQLERIAYA